MLEDLLHLTWPGRGEYVANRIRCLFVDPAPAAVRCYMGGPLGGWSHCPRRAEDDRLWCTKHLKEIHRG